MKTFTVAVVCTLALLHLVLSRKHGNRMRHVLPRHLDQWLPTREVQPHVVLRRNLDHWLPRKEAQPHVVLRRNLDHWLLRKEAQPHVVLRRKLDHWLPRKEGQPHVVLRRKLDHWLPRKEGQPHVVLRRKLDHWLPRKEGEPYVVLRRNLDHWLPRREAHILPRDIGDFMKSNMNDYVDKVVVSLSSRLGKMGYDPMPLPDDVREFSVKDPMGFPWHGKLGLHNGTLEDLSTMKRDGDAIITYNVTKPVVDVTIKFDDLTLIYKYDALIMNIGPQGTIEAIVSGLRVNVLLEADLKTMKMKLKKLRLLDATKIKVHTKGLYMADYVVDGIADCVSFLAKKVILRLVEQRVREEAEKVVESIDLNQYIG